MIKTGKVKISLRYALLVPFILFALILLIFINQSQIKITDQLISDESVNLLRSNTEQVSVELSSYLELPFDLHEVILNNLSREKIKKDFKVLDYIKDIFYNVYIKNEKPISMIQLGMESGDFAGISNIGEITTYEKNKLTNNELVEKRDNSNKISIITKYDPRTRPWYLPVKESTSNQWSELYVSEANQNLVAISALSPIFEKNSNNSVPEFSGVLSSDLSLYGLSRFLEKTSLYRNYTTAFLYIVDDKGHVIAKTNSSMTAEANASGDEKSQIKIPLAGKTGIDLIDISYKNLPGIDDPFDINKVHDTDIFKPRAVTTFSFLKDKEKYLGDVLYYFDNRGLQWRVVALVSESELTGSIKRIQDNIKYLTLAIVTVCTLIGTFIIGLIVKPILSIAEAAKLFADKSTQMEMAMLPELSNSSIREADHLIVSFNNMAEVIGEQIKRLQEMALRDSATNLLNKAGIKEKATWEDKRPITVIAFGIHNFAIISSTINSGHEDIFYRLIASRLTNIAGSKCEVARGNGAEFIIFSNSLSNSDSEELIRVVQQEAIVPYKTDTDEIVIEYSIGVVFDYGSGFDFKNSYLQKASIALSMAMQRGYRERVDYDSVFLEKAIGKSALISKIKAAIEGSCFQVYFQPLIDLNTRELHGFEALARWRNPDGSFTPPSVFIPIAEETGLIVELGGWLLRQACSEVALYIKENEIDGSQFTLHVNVSVRQIFQADFLEVVEHALRISKLDPKILTVEITESLMIQDDNLTSNIFASLRAMGISLAIDDFGTGYSSLSYLNRFKFESLKIDRSFIVAAENNHKSAVVLGAVVNITKGMSAYSVAEGIETEIQANMLKEMGCNYAQGYYFCRPLPMKDIKEYVDSSKIKTEGW